MEHAPLLLIALLAAAPARSAKLELRPIVVDEGFARLAETDALGLGREAAGARAKFSPGTKVALEGLTLRSDHQSLEISPKFAGALERMNAYYGMTRDASPTGLPAELTSTGMADVFEVFFRRVIGLGIPLDGKLVVPEMGGEAAITRGRLALHVLDDPARAAFVELARSRDDAPALRRLFEKRPEAMALIDENGSLKQLLARLPEWERRDKPPADKRRAILREVATTLLETSADRSIVDPAAQVKAICADAWGGVLIGPWHLHPPGWRADGWDPGEPPSDYDRKVAADEGQDLTIVFQPDGFDAYDLAKGRARKVSYRDEGWRRRFQALHDEVK